MNDLPRHTLTRIIARYGREICAAPKRVEALLRDLCGAHRREINIIAGALEERVAADLIAAGKSGPRDVLLARLAARLRDNLAYTPEAARWGVETWAVALGVLSEAEITERARPEAINDGRIPSSRSAGHTNPPATKQPQAAPPPQPQRGPTYAPPQPPTRPTTTNQPPNRPPPVATPASRRTTTPPVIVVAAPPARRHVPPPVVQPPAAPTRPRDRRGVTLRGCFITVVLLLVLIVAAVFVIPAVIAVLQEEQARPSINEPRIRR